MKLTFSLDFDCGSWPGPLLDKEAVAGEAWVGQTGLLSILETTLGLRVPHEPDAVRAAALVPTLKSHAGFWGKSSEVDPFGAAQRLLTWRDRLRLHGWRGQAASTRLSQLARVTAEVMPGFPDRLEAAAGALKNRRPDISALELVDDQVQLPMAWREVFSSLQRVGVKIVQRHTTLAKSKGDLGATRSKSFVPKGDGSVQLLRTPGPLAAAHEVAAWLSTVKDIRSTLIIGGDLVLDEALSRFGLPTLGAATPIYDNTLLQILPLVLEVGWSPADPQKAMELLTLPVSPVPPRLARRLAEALQEWPAVDSESWQTTIQEWQKTARDREKQARQEKRLAAIFNSQTRGDFYPRSQIRKRINLLQEWARGWLGRQNEKGLDWNLVLAQLENFSRVVELSGLDKLTATQLRRAVQDATNSLPSSSAYPAEAGLAEVGAPGCVAGPVDRIVWWSFHSHAARLPEFLPLSSGETRALIKAGVQLPSRGEEALAWTHRWRRPLLYACEQMILVCPRQGEDGEDRFPHPLWDELTAKSKDGLSSLEVTQVKSDRVARRAPRKGLALPQPTPLWRVPKGIPLLREKESPSSLEKKVSCPFAWVVHYLGRLRGGFAGSLSDLNTQEGKLNHAIIAMLLSSGLPKPSQAADKARELFDREGPRLVAQLFLPGNQAQRARCRLVLGMAAEQLVTILHKASLQPKTVEEDVSAPVASLDFIMEGRLDLWADRAIIDLKRGRSKYWRDSLERGSCMQLACYAYAKSGAGKRSFPPVGIFSIADARLLTSQKGVFPGADVIQGPATRETWEGLVKTLGEIKASLGKGKITAPGVDAENPPPAESKLDQGSLVLAPSCNFCEFGVLCGLSFGEGNG